MTEIENLFAVLGGRFISPEGEIRRKLHGIRAFVFDWDGVFNNGEKSASSSSTFSEIDSMGVNLLRFSWFLKTGEMPVVAIISGERNDTAFYFSERECFNYSFYKVPHKIHAIHALCERESMEPSEIAYFFDDVLDIPVAEICGLRILVNQRANVMFGAYCLKHKLVDYLTASPGGRFAVREGAELIMGLNDNFEQVIEGRKSNTADYQSFIRTKRQIKPVYLTSTASGIEIKNP